MANIQKVIIIGAGPAGLLAALRLANHNRLSVSIYELKSEPTTLGGAVGIPSNGLMLLQRLRLYDQLVSRGSITPDIAVHSTKGHLVGTKSMAGYGEGQTGFGYLRIKRTDLVEVLLEAVEKAGVVVNFGKKLVDIEDANTSVKVLFSDGTTDSGDLLLGCDGIHSSVRRLHVDPSVKIKYSGVSNVYGIIDTEGLPKTSANPADLNATLTEDGLFAVTSCKPDAKSIYWFFSREVPLPKDGDEQDGWTQRGKQETDNLKNLLLGLLGDAPKEWISYLREVIERSQTLKFYPIYYVPINQKWWKGRCVLLGDAAHAMPSHISQGTSMALEDAFMISNLLGSYAGHSTDVLLQRYEDIRRPRTTRLLQAAATSAGVRKKIEPWRLRVNEAGFSVALRVFNTLNLDKFGFGQKETVYDIESERL